MGTTQGSSWTERVAGVGLGEAGASVWCGVISVKRAPFWAVGSSVGVSSNPACTAGLFRGLGLVPGVLPGLSFPSCEAERPSFRL